MKDKTLKLHMELIPSTAWESSLYRLMPKEVWNRIRDDFIKKNGRRCQICGETDGTMNLHELWNYDDTRHVQKLDGFILLCGMCHHVKHIGLARILANEGRLDYNEVKKHFCKVNNCSEKEFEKHRAASFAIWENRSKHKWKQDFDKYKEFVKP